MWDLYLYAGGVISYASYAGKFVRDDNITVRGDIVTLRREKYLMIADVLYVPQHIITLIFLQIMNHRPIYLQIYYREYLNKDGLLVS